MKLFTLTVRYPEIEHLPVEERVALLERCLGSPDMRRFQSRARYGRWLVALVVAVLWIPAFRAWPWSPLLIVLLPVTTIGIALVSGLALTIGLQSLLLRRLIRRELAGRRGS